MTRMSRRDALRVMGGGLAALAALGSNVAGAERPEGPHRRRIGRTDEWLPVIGLGTAGTFDVGARRPVRERLAEVLEAFVTTGGTLIDTSPMYGNAEKVVGDLAASTGVAPRLFLATKVWASGRRQGIDQMNESMRRLRTERIDLMQVHNLLDVHTHLDTLQAWQERGRVRYVGVTDYRESRHDEVARIVAARSLDFIQINYSVAERGAERRLLPLALERGVAVIANRPFASGDLLARLAERPLPDFAAEIDCTSWAQLLLKFIVSHPAITCAIPATSKVTHMRDDMAAAYGRMPDEVLRARIAAAAR